MLHRKKISADTGVTVLSNLKVRLDMIDIAKKYVTLFHIFKNEHLWL